MEPSGGTALLEKALSWEWTLRVHSLSPLLLYSLCFLLAIEDVMPQLPTLSVCCPGSLQAQINSSLSCLWSGILSWQQKESDTTSFYVAEVPRPKLGIICLPSSYTLSTGYVPGCVKSIRHIHSHDHDKPGVSEGAQKGQVVRESENFTW